jgi:hypothetical protein
VRVGHSRLCFLQEESARDRLYVAQIGPEQLALLQKDLSDYDTMLKNGTWLALPCQYKGWGAGDVCPYCKRAELYRQNPAA